MSDNNKSTFSRKKFLKLSGLGGLFLAVPFRQPSRPVKEIVISEDQALVGKSSIHISETSVENLHNPLNIHSMHPRFSWMMESEQRRKKQSAYRIIVASTSEKLKNDEGDLWDSGKQEDDQSLYISYQGKPLKSNQHCFWKVRIWDKNGQPSAWSDQAEWSMGFLQASDWKAKWIRAPEFKQISSDQIMSWIEKTSVEDAAKDRLKSLRPAAYYRKTVNVLGSIRRALIRMSGLGYSELYINGEKVGDHVLDPGQTDYGKRALYVTYDVTNYLKKGKNTLGIILGDGWYDQKVGFSSRFRYGEPGVLAQLDVQYTDEEKECFGTDSTWRVSPGPILKNNIYSGEVYDARKELKGWNQPGYMDGGWQNAIPTSALSPTLVPQQMPAIKKIKIIKPIKLFNPKPGVWVYDMGQNFSGWARLKLEGVPKGTAITLGFAEWCDPLGNVDYTSTGGFATGVNQTDMYIAKGGGNETWEPRFTYHGFRYIEMTGYPGKPSKDIVEGVEVRSALETAGTFISSDSVLNRIHETAVWSLASNLHSIPTDCPHRERCGWLGDAHVIAETSIYNFDMSKFGAKYIRDIETSTNKQGTPNDIAPGKRKVNYHVDWGVATIFLPWYYYQYYGDEQFLGNHYEYMNRFMDYYYKQSDSWIVEQGLGDWCDPAAYPGAPRKGGRGGPQHTPPKITSTAYFYFSSKIMTTVAAILEDKGREIKYRGWAQKIKKAFNNHFLDQNKYSYGSQTADGFALYMGLVPEGKEKAVAQSMIHDIADHGGHYTTGAHGTTRLYQELGRYGYDDIAYKVFHARGFPGFPYLFSLGGTTLWERMGSYDPYKMEAPKRSLNHPFQGGYDAYFYQGVAGIAVDPDKPGFKHIIMDPGMINQLEFAKASYHSPYGIIRSNWKNNDSNFTWDITIPVNTTATVKVPVGKLQNITETGKPARKAEGVQYLRMENDRAIFKISSGSYKFESKRVG